MGIYAVTGAASGIGQAVANQLKGSGHEVITVDIRDADIIVDLSNSTQVASALQIARTSTGLNFKFEKRRLPEGLIARG